ncbi:MAG: rhodanese-related sulfurtransferase [Nanoarchaeota archaeon]
MVYKVISFYRYITVQNPEHLRDQLREYCQKHGLFGRILVGKEGINGAVSGNIDVIQQFKEYLHSFPFLNALTFREQDVSHNSFHKLVVKVRKEICAFGAEVDVDKSKGEHLKPETLKRWYEDKEDFVIVDARNDYEFKVGRFRNALNLNINNFREFPKASKQLNTVRNKKIVLYCTGGIRCEKASAYLKEQGFPEVYQIDGGIINYVNQLPNTYWEGGLFVFDDRLVSDVADPITGCKFCGKESLQFLNCHNLDCDKLHIACEDCQQKMNKTCSQECKDAPKHRKEIPQKREIIGIVKNYFPKARAALIKTNKTLTVNTKISFHGKTIQSSIYDISEMRDEKGNEIETASAEQFITIPITEKVRKNDKVLLA